MAIRGLPLDKRNFIQNAPIDVSRAELALWRSLLPAFASHRYTTAHNVFAQSRGLVTALATGGAQMCPAQTPHSACARANTMVLFAQSSIVHLVTAMAMVSATPSWANATVLLVMVALGAKSHIFAHLIARAMDHAL